MSFEVGKSGKGSFVQATEVQPGKQVAATTYGVACKTVAIRISLLSCPV
jgi:hypothetical protein